MANIFTLRSGITKRVKPEGVWGLYNGEVKQLRDQGYTLQGIGDKFGVTRERVRQILEEHYGTTKIPELIPKYRLAEIIGCSDGVLTHLQEQGTLNPIHRGHSYLYNRDEAEKAAREVMRPRTPDVERICEVCGKKFYVKPYQIRPGSPYRFCSKHCYGVWLGKHYGFAAHPENRGIILPGVKGAKRVYCQRCGAQISEDRARHSSRLCQDCYDLLRYFNWLPKAPPRQGIRNTEALAITNRDYQGDFID